jgi:uncharacterized phosphosugar-binding protein
VTTDASLALRLALPALAAAVDEQPRVEEAAAAIAERIIGGGRLYTFGAGHSQSLAAELCSRAGGLTAVTSMSLEDLRDEPRPAHVQLADSQPERDPANGLALLKLYGVGPRDALLIASQSGRNGASVEMARRARAAGTFTVALLSRAHSDAFPSRHPDGLKLGDVVDVVLDNHCPVGDAALRTASGASVSATSTVAGALLAQLINAAVVVELEARGCVPDVIRSANVDVGG